jgi:hypothetical protein
MTNRKLLNQEVAEALKIEEMWEEQEDANDEFSDEEYMIEYQNKIVENRIETKYKGYCTCPDGEIYEVQSKVRSGCDLDCSSDAELSKCFLITDRKLPEYPGIICGKPNHPSPVKSSQDEIWILVLILQNMQMYNSKTAADLDITNIQDYFTGINNLPRLGSRIREIELHALYQYLELPDFKLDVYDHEDTTAGVSGGYCTCPSGQTYAVGDRFTGCKELACTNGISSSKTCFNYEGPWTWKSVDCHVEHNGIIDNIYQNLDFEYRPYLGVRTRDRLKLSKIYISGQYIEFNINDIVTPGIGGFTQDFTGGLCHSDTQGAGIQSSQGVISIGPDDNLSFRYGYICMQGCKNCAPGDDTTTLSQEFFPKTTTLGAFANYKQHVLVSRINEAVLGAIPNLCESQDSYIYGKIYNSSVIKGVFHTGSKTKNFGLFVARWEPNYPNYAISFKLMRSDRR